MIKVTVCSPYLTSPSTQNPSPQNILDHWLVANGALVGIDEPIAEIRVNDELHEILSPATGCLIIDAQDHCAIKRGSVIGRIALTAAACA